MAVKCTKCGASAYHLEPILEILPDDTRLQTVRCILCGERRSRTVLPQPRRRLEEPPRGHRHEWEPCAVVGCDGQVVAALNPRRLCGKCCNRLAVWETTKKTKPAPIQQVADSWYRRGTPELAAALRSYGRLGGAA